VLHLRGDALSSRSRASPPSPESTGPRENAPETGDGPWDGSSQDGPVRPCDRPLETTDKTEGGCGGDGGDGQTRVGTPPAPGNNPIRGKGWRTRL
jgi:hypothetical protein